MSTSSTTVFLNSWDTHERLVSLERHCDGYPDVHGKELAEFLKDFEITQGLPERADMGSRKIANGGDCLAAQAIAHFKTEPGQFYISALDNTWGNWHYTVTPTVGEPVEITIHNPHGDYYWSGTAKELFEWLA